MRTKNLLLAALITAPMSLSLLGCDQATSSNNSSNEVAGTSFLIKGKLAGTGFKSAQVCLNGTCVSPDQSSGEYVLSGNTVPSASARVSAKDSTVGAVYIIVGNDTLKEILISNWNTIIPEKYIVQRNIAVTVPDKYSAGDVQFVYWDNDSIADVVAMPKTSGLKHSAYVYSYYDSTSFMNHDTVYSWFARIKVHDSVKAGTAINKLTYDAGDVVIDSGDFAGDLFVAYYKTVPSGDSVGQYVTGAKATAYNTRKDSVLAFTLADTNNSDALQVQLIAGSCRFLTFILKFSDTTIDSARITYTATGRVAVDADDTTKYHSYSSSTSGTYTFTVPSKHTDAIYDISYITTSSYITDLKVYYIKH